MNIVLYSTHCPKCTILEKKLQMRGLKYKVETDVDKMVEMGFRSAPTLEVNGIRMDFMAAIRWLGSLDQNGEH